MRRILFPILFGNREPQIRLSGLTVEENVALGTVVGTLSVVNGSGVYTFTEDDDPNELFEIDGDEVKTNAVVDYDIYPGTVSYTVIADNGVDPAITRTFTITLTNILEVTLNALTLDNDEIVETEPEDTVVGALVGVSSGSTLALTDDASGRFKLSGNNVARAAAAAVIATYNITVRETHADATNTPNDTPLTIDVIAAPVGGSPTFHFLGF
jgi:hypothetical protein